MRTEKMKVLTGGASYEAPAVSVVRIGARALLCVSADGITNLKNGGSETMEEYQLW